MSDPPPRAYFPCLNAYRAIGMLMVLLAHASFATGFDDRSEWGRYIARFDLAVPMFFMLSAFLLYRPYAAAMLRDDPVTAAGLFFRRRVFRVFPAYWVALIGLTLIFGAKWMVGPAGWVTNIFLLQQFGVNEPYRITQAWSIGVELSYYLLLPIYVIVVRRWLAGRSRSQNLSGQLIAGLVLVLAGQGFRIAVVSLTPSWENQSLLWLPMYLDFFGIGMILATLHAAHQQGFRVSKLVLRAANHPALCWVVAVVIVLLVAQMDPPDQPFGLNGREYVPRQAAYVIASAIWLLPAMFGDQHKGRLRGFLRSRPLVYLGAISLSFYLWHLEFVDVAKRITVANFGELETRAANAAPDSLEGLVTFTGNFLFVAIVAFVLTTVVAAVIHRFVELPFQRIKDRPLRYLPSIYRGLLLRRPHEDARGQDRTSDTS